MLNFKLAIVISSTFKGFFGNTNAQEEVCRYGNATHRLVCDLSAVGDGDAAAGLLGDGPGAGFNTVVIQTRPIARKGDRPSKRFKVQV